MGDQNSTSTSFSYHFGKLKVSTLTSRTFSSWRTSSEVKLARLRRPKIIYSPSYADYRTKTNAVILLDMGHTLIRNKDREGNLKLESV
jgi:hypothetical protein